jgi:tyrosyl-tRNA synthetase
VPNDHDLLADLDARGLIHDSTDREALAERLDQGPVTLYCGFDPTADSLHVGSLLGLVNLRRFLDAGHRPLVLTGGATGMIGDPSGRSDERNLLDAETLAANLRGISAQITRVLGPGGSWELVDNADWTADVRLLDFLRDVGKHVTVNQMIARESVQARMQAEAGISFTEFSYQLLQAHELWWLRANRDCELQIGGSDQWGNIVAGVDLVRRRGAGAVHGLTWPLLLRSDGTKFGKSAAGESVWLDAARTSPYRFFQFWMQVEDADVERLLLQLTLASVDEIAEVVAAQRAEPAGRIAQSRLALEVTSMVHGTDAAAQARAASRILFGGSAREADAAALTMLVDEVPTLRLARGEVADGLPIQAALVRSGLCTSNGEARRTIDQGGGYCNDERVGGETTIAEADLLHGRFALLRRGRKAYALVVVGDD